jgi:hypothetical protein
MMRQPYRRSSGSERLVVRLVLDDFGKGYSSFGYLSRAHFSKIKIDQSFVRGAADGAQDCVAIVHAILALSRGLGCRNYRRGGGDRRAGGCDAAAWLYPAARLPFRSTDARKRFGRAFGGARPAKGLAGRANASVPMTYAGGSA